MSPDYNKIFTKKSWDTLSIENPAQLFQDFLSWYKTQELKWPDSSIKKVSKYVARLWSALNFVEREQIAEILVSESLDSSIILNNMLCFHAIAAQFQIEKMMKERLAKAEKSIEKGDKPTRLIAIHPKSVDDKEVQDATLLQLAKHGFEQCIIKTTVDGVRQALQIPTIKTVATIGHGYTRTRGQRYTCGPCEGMHDDVAVQWGQLINSAPQVEHLRLVSCYYGLANPEFDVKRPVRYNTAKYSRDSGRVTALVTYTPSQPLPFDPSSMAAMIWQNVVVKNKRNNFCLSATPRILNPLPPYQPSFFAACDKDHYVGGDGVHQPMWQDGSLRDLDKTKAISLATDDSYKIIQFDTGCKAG